jgi:hypothetical protein
MLRRLILLLLLAVSFAQPAIAGRRTSGLFCASRPAIGSVWLGTSRCRMWNFSKHSGMRTKGHIPIRSGQMQPLPYYLL